MGAFSDASFFFDDLLALFFSAVFFVSTLLIRSDGFEVTGAGAVVDGKVGWAIIFIVGAANTGCRKNCEPAVNDRE